MPVRRGTRRIFEAGGVLAVAISMTIGGETAATYQAPRTEDGRAHLNTVWQAVAIPVSRSDQPSI